MEEISLLLINLQQSSCINGSKTTPTMLRLKDTTKKQCKQDMSNFLAPPPPTFGAHCNSLLSLVVSSQS